MVMLIITAIISITFTNDIMNDNNNSTSNRIVIVIVLVVEMSDSNSTTTTNNNSNSNSNRRQRLLHGALLVEDLLERVLVYMCLCV